MASRLYAIVKCKYSYIFFLKQSFKVKKKDLFVFISL